MIDVDAAVAIAESELRRLERPGLALRLLTRLQQEHPFGWVFFYQTKEYVETGNPAFGVGGNAPFIVERSTGRVVHLGTALRAEEYIKMYLRGEI